MTSAHHPWRLIVGYVASFFLLSIIVFPHDSYARHGDFSSFRALHAACSTRLLMMPPSARLAMGQENSLKDDCEKKSTGQYYWEPEVEKCDYRLAIVVFDIVAGGNAASIWFPKMMDQERKLEPFIHLLNDNSERLGGLQVTTSSWPKSPATRLDLSWRQESSKQKSGNNESVDNIATSIQATEKWVEEKLCGLSLCPYTYSMQRAAVGLDSVGVAEGPICIRHAENNFKNTARAQAATLAKSFWLGVQELAHTSEENVSTLLIVAPSYYDQNFLEFAATFDKLLEPSVQATGAEAIVGRALFHPTYNSDLIGHDQVLPGHALPAKMVEGFMDRYLADDAEESIHNTKMPALSVISKANDAVRWTPHATINLLRRSQVSSFLRSHHVT